MPFESIGLGRAEFGADACEFLPDFRVGSHCGEVGFPWAADPRYCRVRATDEPFQKPELRLRRQARELPFDLHDNRGTHDVETFRQLRCMSIWKQPCVHVAPIPNPARSWRWPWRPSRRASGAGGGIRYAFEFTALARRGMSTDDAPQRLRRRRRRGDDWRAGLWAALIVVIVLGVTFGVITMTETALHDPNPPGNLPPGLLARMEADNLNSQQRFIIQAVFVFKYFTAKAGDWAYRNPVVALGGAGMLALVGGLVKKLAK